MLLRFKLDLTTIMAFYGRLLNFYFGNRLCRHIQCQLIGRSFIGNFEAFVTWTEYHLLQERYLVLELCHLIDQRSEEHTSELQSRENLVCRLLLEKKKEINAIKRY